MSNLFSFFFPTLCDVPLSPPTSPQSGVLALVRALERPVWGALLRDLWARSDCPLSGGPRPTSGGMRFRTPLHVRRRGEKLVGASSFFITIPLSSFFKVSTSPAPYF